MSSFPRLRKLKLKRHLLRNQTPQSTAIQVRIMPSLGIMGHTTMPPRQRSPTGGQANFYINNCGDPRSLDSSPRVALRIASESPVIRPKMMRVRAVHLLLRGLQVEPAPVAIGLEVQGSGRWDYNSRMSSTGQSTGQVRQAQDVDAIPTLAWAARPDGSARLLNRRWLDFTRLSTEEGVDL